MEAPSWRALREAALSGERITGCEKCYDEEEADIRSLRQKSIALHGTDTTVEIAQLDVNFSNHCNLKCRFCSAASSSSIAAEDRQHRGFRGKALLTSGFDPNATNLSALRQLEFLGGEPLLQQDAMIATLNRVLATHPDPASIEVSYTTNATFRPGEDLAQRLAAFPKRAVWFSIDAWGGLNDYIRGGSRFEDVVETLDWYFERFGREKGRWFVITAINAYNIHHLGSLAAYVAQRWPFVKHRHHFVYHPHWITAWSLPQVYRETLADEYEANNPCDINVADRLRLGAGGDFQSLITHTHELDRIRSERLQSVNAELASIIANQAP